MAKLALTVVTVLCASLLADTAKAQDTEWFRADLGFTLNRYRIRYYESRGGDDLIEGAAHGTQNITPFVGVAWRFDHPEPEATPTGRRPSTEPTDATEPTPTEPIATEPPADATEEPTVSPDVTPSSYVAPSPEPQEPTGAP